MKKFNCTMCGACCRHADRHTDFPEPVREDGSCSHLTEDNKCDIYENRPLICQVNGYWEKYMQDSLSLEMWQRINYQACAKLIKEDGLDPSLIPEPDGKNS